MKANPGGPMRKNFPSAFKQDEGEKEMDLSKLSDQEIVDAMKRNLDPSKVHGRTYELATDTIAAGSKELEKRYNIRNEKKAPTRKVRVKPKQTLTSFGKIGGWKHANTKLAEEKAAKGKKKYI